MLHRKINIELLVPHEAEAVIGELNGAVDLLEDRHTVVSGGIETVAIERSGTRKRSAPTMAAIETVTVALRTARQDARLLRAVI